MSGYSTGTDNRLSTDGVWNYTWDSEGNLTQRTNIATGEIWLYYYDQNNHMTKAEHKASSGGAVDLRITFAFDALGNRIERDYDADGDGGGAATVEKYAVDPQGNAWADMTSGGSLTTRRLNADAVDTIFARIASGTVNWYGEDRLGSIRDIFDSAGSLIDQLNYSSYGKPVYESNPGNSDREGFQGRDREDAIGANFFRARIEFWETGQFGRADPLSFEGGDTNLRRFEGNNPTNKLDPSGTQVLAEGEWPGWVRRMIARPDPYAPMSAHTVDRVTRVYYDRNHAGGAHYDVRYELSNGNTRNQRFWRDGTALTEAENRALSAGRRPRRGSFDLRTAATLGLTAIVVGGVELVYDHYVQTAAARALTRGRALLIGRYVRTVLHSGELPEVYTRFGVVGTRFFQIYIDGQMLTVFLEPLRDSGGLGIRILHRGDLLLSQDECPLSGL